MRKITLQIAGQSEAEELAIESTLLDDFAGFLSDYVMGVEDEFGLFFLRLHDGDDELEFKISNKEYCESKDEEDDE